MLLGGKMTLRLNRPVTDEPTIALGTLTVKTALRYTEAPTTIGLAEKY